MDSKLPTGDYETLSHSTCDHVRGTPHGRSKLWSRKFIFLATLLLVWLGWRGISDLIKFRRAMHFRMTEFSSIGFSIPPDIVVDHCVSWQEAARRTAADAPKWPQHYDEASAEFELPISSEKLFLLARGMTAGDVMIRQRGEGDAARVKIVARYRNFEALQEVEVCAVNRGEGDNGVGIFGPRWVPRGQGVGFTVYLDLPVPKDGSALNVKSLATDMPFFAQFVCDIQNGVHFDSISLQTANLPISVGSLHATTARSETSNAPITGNFNVSSSLALVTSNAKIDATANLYNDKEIQGATDLKLHTTNGPIKADLNLASAEGIGGAFTIDASTYTSRLDLAFLTAPVDSALSVAASTSFGPIQVKLHETYQGRFNLRTSFSSVKVEYDPQQTDPAGEGRRRKVDIRPKRSLVEGSATWSEEGLKLGSVDVQTSFSPVTLNL